MARLRAFYGVLTSPPRDPFMLFVWGVLDAQSTPQKRDAALGALKRLPALTPDSLARAPQAKLEAAVALAGAYQEERLNALRVGASVFRRAPRLSDAIRGPLSGARRAVRQLPQLGDPGAHRMLLFAADRAIVPVDSRVCRVALRLGYGTAAGDFGATARRVRRALISELDSLEACRDAAIYLLQHGSATCVERNPHCAVCPVVEDCPAAAAGILN